MKLMRARLDKYVYFMDESSVSLWSNIKHRTWSRGHTKEAEGVTLPMQERCGKNKTVIAAVGGGMYAEEANFQFIYSIA